MKKYRITKYFLSKAVCVVAADNEDDALEKFEESRARIELIQETEEPEIEEVEQ